METACLIWLHSEALQLEGGCVTWNLNIQQIQPGASVPACWVAIWEGGRSEGQGTEWRLECVKGKTSNSVVGRAQGACCKKRCVELNNSWCSTNFDSGENCFLTVPKARQWDQKSKRKLNARGENTLNQHNIKLATCLRLQVLSKHMNTHFKPSLKLSIQIYAHTDLSAIIGKYFIIIFQNSSLVLMQRLPGRN